MKNILFKLSLIILPVIAIFAVAFSWVQAGDIDPNALVMASGATVINVSTDEQRAVFGRLQNWFPQNLNSPADSFIITETTLQVEQYLVSNSNSYKFDLYDGSNTANTPTELKLNRNDLFFATHISLGIRKIDPSKTPIWYANLPIFTYPDSNYFVGTGTSNAIEYQALETIYNGNIVFETGNVNRFGPLATSLLKYVPERPYELGVASSPAVTAVYAQYGPDMAGRGFHRLTPNLVIDGQQTNRFNVSLGAGDIVNIAGATNAAGSAADTRNLLILQVHGFKAVDAAAAAKAAGNTPITF